MGNVGRSVRRYVSRSVQPGWAKRLSVALLGMLPFTIVFAIINTGVNNGQICKWIGPVFPTEIIMTDIKPTTEPAAPPAPTRRFWRRPQPTPEDLSDRKIRKWSELWETLILALATLITAWAGYEAGKWNGIQTALNTQATVLNVETGRLRTEAQERLLIDIMLFTDWVNATGTGNTELADFYQARFRDGFQPAFEAWLATDPLSNPDAPASPFEMDVYDRFEIGAIETLINRAGDLNRSAEQAGAIADRYTLSVVILAGALLLAGLANRFEWAELRAVVVALALLVLLFSAVNVIRLPIA